MIDFRNIEGIYFVGIGGIGMSALALYFSKGGYTIAGYDRSESRITLSLSESGCKVSYEDNVNGLPDPFRNSSDKNRVIIVYTPAIPPENRILSYFSRNGYRLYKRSEVLGEISANTDTLAVAGTHGKTTVSTIIAHLLKQSHVDCSAFLGGISKNYNSNLLLGEGRYTVWRLMNTIVLSIASSLLWQFSHRLMTTTLMFMVIIILWLRHIMSSVKKSDREAN
jgi:UDP-N-acetylmuramate--alanine ligase